MKLPIWFKVIWWLVLSATVTIYLAARYPDLVGTFGSRDLVHTPFGRKIEKAVKYREAGLPL